MTAPTVTQPARLGRTADQDRPASPPPAVHLDLPAPISLVPIVVAILLAVVAVWALAWLAWIP